MPVTNYYSVDGLVIGEKTTGGSRIDYLTDMLGSVTATVDQTAQVRNTYRYKPYGELLTKTGTDPDPAFGWVGTQGYRATQKKFSNFYVRARHADTTTGRWPNIDPLGYEPQSGTLYPYASCNPVSLLDPSGLQYVGHNYRTTGCIPGSCQFVVDRNNLDRGIIPQSVVCSSMSYAAALSLAIQAGYKFGPDDSYNIGLVLTGQITVTVTCNVICETYPVKSVSISIQECKFKSRSNVFNSASSGTACPPSMWETTIDDYAYREVGKVKCSGGDIRIERVSCDPFILPQFGIFGGGASGGLKGFDVIRKISITTPGRCTGNVPKQCKSQPWQQQGPLPL